MRLVHVHGVSVHVHVHYTCLSRYFLGPKNDLSRILYGVPRTVILWSSRASALSIVTTCHDVIEGRDSAHDPGSTRDMRFSRTRARGGGSCASFPRPTTKFKSSVEIESCLFSLLALLFRSRSRSCALFGSGSRCPPRSRLLTWPFRR